MSVRILRGDVLAMLSTLPDESVHCCVTSPPYYGLRDYGVAGQLGLEPTLAEYIEKMVAVFREVRRVLRSDGTLWLNIGDSYAGSWGAQSRGGPPSDKSTLQGNGHIGGGPKLAGLSTAQIAAHPKRESNTGTIRDEGLKPKDLMMVPERLALALQADGWWVRSRIIWHKRSTMPESVTDRPTKAHEHIWLLTKSELYYYDSEAASEPVSDSFANDPRHRTGGNDNNIKAGYEESGAQNPKGPHRLFDGSEKMTRNWRDVWSLGPEPFKEAHFATFPTEIPRRAIVAGCPALVCSSCGAPQEKILSRTPAEVKAPYSEYGNGAGRNDGNRSMLIGARSDVVGVRPGCGCGCTFVSGTVLDPFLGSGTTALVADRLQRNAIGIELNPAYADMAEKRIRGDSPLFAEVA